ncbi:MAG: SufE family protein [Aquiluna sp.]|nr:SufE family protein [Aquiluna sp.]MCF8545119.1 SufE family protein [Aquiluna sp.]
MNSKAAAVVEDFSLVEAKDRLELLLEYSEALPDLDPKFEDHPELLERVEECQSPVFIAVEGNEGQVHLHFSAPREAPTTRGFASVLNSALNGLSAKEILELSDDFPSQLGLDKLISPLRVRGMRGMLFRIKRKTKELVSS